MAEQKNIFDIRKIYVKDASLECPNSPEIFLEELTQPEISIDASIRTKRLEQEGYYEVLLLSPINFEALFHQKLKSEAEAKKQAAEEENKH